MVDWESIRDKYENNCETFVSNLLKQTGSKEYTHSGDFFLPEKGLQQKSNRFEENIEKLWMQGGEVEESGLCSNELAGYQLRNLSRLV